MDTFVCLCSLKNRLHVCIHFLKRMGHGEKSIFKRVVAQATTRRDTDEDEVLFHFVIKSTICTCVHVFVFKAKFISCFFFLQEKGPWRTRVCFLAVAQGTRHGDTVEHEIKLKFLIKSTNLP